MQDQIINQGVELMLYGMGTVVLFLALLVVATGLMSHLLARYRPRRSRSPRRRHNAPPIPRSRMPNWSR